MNVFKDSSQSIEMSGVSLEAGFDLFVGFGKHTNVLYEVKMSIQERLSW